MSELRCSDADRERALRALRAGHAEGRLDDDELEGRVAAVWRARHTSELDALTRDLPPDATLPPALHRGRVFAVHRLLPEPADRAVAALLDVLAPALSTEGYELVERTAARIVYARRRLLLGTDHVTIEIAPEGEAATRLSVHGSGPVGIRRALGRL
jgi:hypothetical protein